MNAQQATSRALALAATPYQQSGARVDILAHVSCGTCERMGRVTVERGGYLTTATCPTCAGEGVVPA